MKRRISSILFALVLVMSLGTVALPMASEVEASPVTIQVEVNDGSCVSGPQGDSYHET